MSESANLQNLAAGDRATGRRALLVVGMHRSGTSAVARSLGALGVPFPRTPLPPGKGGEVHWGESAPIEAVHEELLASAGTSWDDPLPFPQAWYGTPAAEEYVARMATVVTDEYGDSNPFVVKDPRICRLVPFWIAVLQRLEIEPAFVLPVRNPLEVAASLVRRDQFPASRCAALWLRHVLDAERDTRAFRRAFVSYEDMLSDPASTATAIFERLGLEMPRLAQAEAQLGEVLSANQRHHAFTAEDLAGDEDVAEWVKEAYAMLLDASRSGNAPDPDALDRLSDGLSNADMTYGAALAESERRAEELREKVKGLAVLEHRHKRTVADLNTTKDNLRSTRERLANKEQALAEARRQLSAAHRRELTWARAAREIERSRTWRVGNFLIRALRLLTFRRPAPSQGPRELAARIESGDRGDDSSKPVRQVSAAEQMSE